MTDWMETWIFITPAFWALKALTCGVVKLVDMRPLRGRDRASAVATGAISPPGEYRGAKTQTEARTQITIGPTQFEPSEPVVRIHHGGRPRADEHMGAPVLGLVDTDR